jgi:4-alpha-glucanotransferase
MQSFRKSGILLHISSLPSAFGIGDLGQEAYNFVDTLSKNGMKIWQILPLGPNGPGNSPYQAYSAYAGDPILISPEMLVDWGLLSKEDLSTSPLFNDISVDFEKVTEWKTNIFRLAWQNFKLNADTSFINEYQAFLNEHGWWLNDYALYTACKIEFDGLAWNKWPNDLMERDQNALDSYKIELKENYEFERFVQFLFIRQWFRLKNYANEKGIQIFGDLPLYVSLDSSDVWGNQRLFLLDKNGEPSMVGGVPPDYFCEDGQLWGNPVYDWNEIEKNNFQWWLARLYFNFHMFDLVRIDHFRGLESFWAIPADSKTARVGQWLPAKGFELLNILQSQLVKLPIIAEDLGIITPEVEYLRDHFNLPGMKVLQFAFTSDFTNEHLPHNISSKNIIYTGTHDNDTIIGWWMSIDAEEKKLANSYLSANKGTISERLITYAWASVAEIAILPLQDLMLLDGSARMNVPGIATGNWSWRFRKNQLRKNHWEFIKKLNVRYNR